MEQKYNKSVLRNELTLLREFCEREGETVTYCKGEVFEHQGEPSRWLAFVDSGYFKYVTHGVSDDKDHITWFSFDGEFVADYPSFLYGRPSQTTISAMLPSRVLRVSGDCLKDYFSQNIRNMELRAVISEHILSQFRSCYIDFHCATPRERYEMLMKRCPGIVNDLPLNAIASFLNITPKTMSMLRHEITFDR